MTIYSLGVYGFEQFTTGPPVDSSGPLPGDPLSVRLSDTMAVPGTLFRFASATPDLSPLMVADAEDGTPRIAVESALGSPGDAVMLQSRITVTTTTLPAREIGLHLVRVGENVRGVLGGGSLKAGMPYKVVRRTDPDPTKRLRDFAADAADAPGPLARPWEAALCFAHGTEIDTPYGARPIEDLAPGDLVSTLDNGSQPVRWIGHRYITREMMILHKTLRPVKFAEGTVGNRRRLLVSPLHRVLLNDWRAEVYFGEDQVLIPARALMNGGTIRQILPQAGITYAHLLFDRHEVILSEGTLSESFHPGESGLEALDRTQQEQIEALFSLAALKRRRAAFPIVRLDEARALRLPG